MSVIDFFFFFSDFNGAIFLNCQNFNRVLFTESPTLFLKRTVVDFMPLNWTPYSLSTPNTLLHHYNTSGYKVTKTKMRITQGLRELFVYKSPIYIAS